MRLEIKSASDFLRNLLRAKFGENNNPQLLDRFRLSLEIHLMEHYQEHWFPDSPCKGSGYRCIRINQLKMDPILSRAGSDCGFDEVNLRELFPAELTLWIDPREVAYRIGENGSICVLYDGSASRPKGKCLPRKLTYNGNSPPRSESINIKNNQQQMSENSCSPMSISPSSPVLHRTSSCKESLHDSDLIVDPRNMRFEIPTYVSS